MCFRHNPRHFASVDTGSISHTKRLPSVPPSRGRTPPFGLHRYKPVRARISLARQGISLESFCDSTAITSPGGPACRHAVRTISSSRSRGRDVRRMASEDSDQFFSWFLVVHGLHNGGDFSDAPV